MNLLSTLEPLTDTLLATLGPRAPSDPTRDLLAKRRAALRLAIEGRVLPRAKQLEPRVLARDPSAVSEYDALAAEAVAELRGWARDPRDPLGKFLAALDAWLYRNRPELMDDPSLDVRSRERALELLDRFNVRTGSYDSFTRLVEAAIGEGAVGGPLVVHDLATGHGGFARHLASALGGRAVVQASDQEAEYFERSAARDRAGAARVAFSVRDALDLGELTAGGVDVFTCTNTLHHFTPGQVARMFGEAARAARRAVVFVDGERRLLTYLALSIVGRTYGASPVFHHDSVASARRMFDREEIALLAALAPGVPDSMRVAIELAKPAHVALIAQNRQTAPGAA